jgi:hypothetical protein
LAIAITLLNGAMKPRERTQKNMIPQMSDAFGEASRAPEKSSWNCELGWMSEKYPPPRG